MSLQMTINMMKIVTRRMVRMKSPTIFLPGETGRRDPTGLTHKRDEAALNHSQRRHLIRSTDTGRNWGGGDGQITEGEIKTV